MDEKKDMLEFIKLAKDLRTKNRDAFLETKGYLRGLTENTNLNSDSSKTA